MRGEVHPNLLRILNHHALNPLRADLLLSGVVATIKANKEGRIERQCSPRSVKPLLYIAFDINWDFDNRIDPSLTKNACDIMPTIHIQVSNLERGTFRTT